MLSNSVCGYFPSSTRLRVWLRVPSPPSPSGLQSLKVICCQGCFRFCEGSPFGVAVGLLVWLGVMVGGTGVAVSLGVRVGFLVAVKVGVEVAVFVGVSVTVD